MRNTQSEYVAGRRTIVSAGCVVILILLSFRLDRAPVAGISDARLEMGLLLSFGLIGTLSASKIGSASQIYSLAFMAFHYGLLFAFLVSGFDGIPLSINSAWMNTHQFSLVLFQVSIGTAALITGITGFAIYDRIRLSRGEVPSILDGTVHSYEGSRRVEKADDSSRLLRVSGALLFLCGMAFVILQLLLAGFQFTAGYGEFRSAVEGNAEIGYGFLMIGVGAGVYAAAPKSRFLPWVLVVTTLLLFLPSGARSAALFPAAVVVAIRARYETYRVLPFSVAVVATLGAISAVQASRLEGLAGLKSGIDFSPMSALSEMGSSIVPVFAALTFVENGRPFWLGQSFFVVPLRVIEGLLGRPVPDAISDMRFFSSEVTWSFGQIGGSPIAEGFSNGGTLGVVIVMFAIGSILAWIDRGPQKYWSLALRVVALYALLVAVRNAAAPMIVMLASGVLLVGISWLVTRGLFEASEQNVHSQNPAAFVRPGGQ